MDHILAVERGGTNDPTNLVVACKVCNSKKSTTDYTAFIDKEIIRVTLQLETLLKRRSEK